MWGPERKTSEPYLAIHVRSDEIASEVYLVIHVRSEKRQVSLIWQFMWGLKGNQVRLIRQFS